MACGHCFHEVCIVAFANSRHMDLHTVPCPVCKKSRRELAEPADQLLSGHTPAFDLFGDDPPRGQGKGKGKGAKAKGKGDDYEVQGKGKGAKAKGNGDETEVEVLDDATTDDGLAHPDADYLTNSQGKGKCANGKGTGAIAKGNGYDYAVDADAHCVDAIGLGLYDH